MRTRILLLAAFLHCGSAAAGETYSLFDGETLDGWRLSEENPGSFSVRDGMIVADGPRAHLFYAGEVEGGEFGSFELRLQVKTEAGSNSGVFFHTSYQASGWPTDGIEAQVNATHKDPRRTGSLYGLAELWWSEANDFPLVEVTRKVSRHRLAAPPNTDGEWFDYAIRVEEGGVTVSVDGAVVMKWQERPGPYPQARLLDGGTFALQAHDPNSVVYYRNIEVEILGDEGD